MCLNHLAFTWLFNWNTIEFFQICILQLIYVDFSIHCTAYCFIELFVKTIQNAYFLDHTILYLLLDNTHGTSLYFRLNLEVRFTVSYPVKCYIMELKCTNIQHSGLSVQPDWKKWISSHKKLRVWRRVSGKSIWALAGS